jgi:heme-degrading monooxygenase HmoA
MAAMSARFLSRDAEEKFLAFLPQVLTQVKAIKGFIRVEFWRNEIDEHILLEESFWETKEGAMEWRDHPFHKKLQQLAFSTLVMENTTTWWDMSGKASLYLKCPVCHHQLSVQKDLALLSSVTQTPDCCEECGFEFPYIGDIGDRKLPLYKRP